MSSSSSSVQKNLPVIDLTIPDLSWRSCPEQLRRGVLQNSQEPLSLPYTIDGVPISLENRYARYLQADSECQAELVNQDEFEKYANYFLQRYSLLSLHDFLNICLSNDPERFKEKPISLFHFYCRWQDVQGRWQLSFHPDAVPITTILIEKTHFTVAAYLITQLDKYIDREYGDQDPIVVPTLQKVLMPLPPLQPNQSLYNRNFISNKATASILIKIIEHSDYLANITPASMKENEFSLQKNKQALASIIDTIIEKISRSSVKISLSRGVVSQLWPLIKGYDSYLIKLCIAFDLYRVKQVNNIIPYFITALLDIIDTEHPLAVEQRQELLKFAYDHVPKLKTNIDTQTWHHYFATISVETLASHWAFNILCECHYFTFAVYMKALKENQLQWLKNFHENSNNYFSPRSPVTKNIDPNVAPGLISASPKSLVHNLFRYATALFDDKTVTKLWDFCDDQENSKELSAGFFTDIPHVYYYPMGYIWESEQISRANKIAVMKQFIVIYDSLGKTKNYNFSSLPLSGYFFSCHGNYLHDLYFWLIHNNDEDAIKELFASGDMRYKNGIPLADIDYFKDNNTETPLAYAIKRERWEIAKVLIEHDCLFFREGCPENDWELSKYIEKIYDTIKAPFATKMIIKGLFFDEILTENYQMREEKYKLLEEKQTITTTAEQQLQDLQEKHAQALAQLHNGANDEPYAPNKKRKLTQPEVTNRFEKLYSDIFEASTDEESDSDDEFDQDAVDLENAIESSLKMR